MGYPACHIIRYYLQIRPQKKTGTAGSPFHIEVGHHKTQQYTDCILLVTQKSSLRLNKTKRYDFLQGTRSFSSFISMESITDCDGTPPLQVCGRPAQWRFHPPRWYKLEEGS